MVPTEHYTSLVSDSRLARLSRASRFPRAYGTVDSAGTISTSATPTSRCGSGCSSLAAGAALECSGCEWGFAGAFALAGGGVGMAMRTATRIMLGLVLRWCSSAIACPISRCPAGAGPRPDVTGAGSGDVSGGVGFSTLSAREKNARCRGMRGSSSADGEADPEDEIAAAGDAAVPEAGASSPGPPLPRTLVVDGVEPKPLVGRLCVLCAAEIVALVSAGLLTYVAENGLMVSQSLECSARQ